MTSDGQKTSALGKRRDNISAPRKAEPVRLGEAERKLKMAERSALLMQLAAIEEYLDIKRRCKKCGADI